MFLYSNTTARARATGVARVVVVLPAVLGAALAGTARAQTPPVATATEALLAAQMVGAQRAAMTYLHRALMPDQESEAIDGTSPVPCA